MTSIQDFLGYPDDHFFAMEFREGQTLREHDECTKLPVLGFNCYLVIDIVFSLVDSPISDLPSTGVSVMIDFEAVIAHWLSVLESTSDWYREMVGFLESESRTKSGLGFDQLKHRGRTIRDDNRIQLRRILGKRKPS